MGDGRGPNHKPEYVPDKRPDASGRKKPRPGSTGPNGVANKFLAALRGKPVKVWIPGRSEGASEGVLVEFDAYSLVIQSGGRKRCIWKGPGLVVEPA